MAVPDKYSYAVIFAGYYQKHISDTTNLDQEIIFHYLICLYIFNFRIWALATSAARARTTRACAATRTRTRPPTRPPSRTAAPAPSGSTRPCPSWRASSWPSWLSNGPHQLICQLFSRPSSKHQLLMKEGLISCLCQLLLLVSDGHVSWFECEKPKTLIEGRSIVNQLLVSRKQLL